MTDFPPGFIPTDADFAAIEAGSIDNITLDSSEVSTVGAINSTITTTETNITKMASGLVTVTAGDLIGFDIKAILQNSIASDEFYLRIRKGTAVSGTLVQQITVYRPNHTAGYQLTTWIDWPCSATETTNFYVSLVRATGTGNLTVYGQSGTGMAIRRLGLSSVHRAVA